jgi:hypothetical protein
LKNLYLILINLVSFATSRYTGIPSHQLQKIC